MIRLINYLKEKSLVNLCVDEDDILVEQKKIIKKKKLLKDIVFSYYRKFISFDELYFSGKGKKVELGAGTSLIKELFPESHVGILFDQNNYITNIKKIFNQYKDNNFFSCGFDINIISDEIISLCKNYEMKITVYSSKNISILEAYNLWKKGVSSIFIDNPLSYKKILN